MGEPCPHFHRGARQFSSQAGDLRLFRAYRTATCRRCQLTGLVLLLPLLDQLGQHFKLAPTFSKTEVLSLLVKHHLRLEFQRKRAPLQLFFLDAFRCAILPNCFHDSAFAKYST
jgi:hypothetical protein